MNLEKRKVTFNSENNRLMIPEGDYFEIYRREGNSLYSVAESIESENVANLFEASLDMLDALYSVLNIEGAAKAGAFKGLDVGFHFDKVRKAIKRADPSADFA